MEVFFVPVGSLPTLIDVGSDYLGPPKSQKTLPSSPIYSYSFQNDT